MIISTLNDLIKKAIADGASDLHFEPQKSDALVRMRVDGLLQEILKTKKEILIQLISRIKVLAHLNLAEKRLPQDGRIFMKVEEKRVDLRISTIPTVFGEKAVIRILNKEASIKSLEKLDMFPKELAEFKKMLSKKHGIILVSGPTGSGKTTTLYAALQKLNQAEVNIITIEDPVEYSFEQINQIQVNEKIGMTFERGLRAVLRQDPDIIMVGEIRDKETAKIAITAAMTGHLVLSTIHTNDCVSTVGRLIDMGIEPYLISGALIGLISQRLTRKISGETYKGRQAVFEVLTIDEELSRLISSAAAKDVLLNHAKLKGMHTLLENGLQLVASGITTKEEILRVMSE
ncbi:MAG: GspE/PulE family protein [Candidatus Margulisbacteria bacterium]|nr:GspE/PulE family protein [Candidatus Margulisiibacteriota bacterium]MBU1022416.1 GspE/PulE family protein [Candidatus Margulisiibacteriota bacterium]MBU1729032.1 GspE/PulE family protein [Candidatus Margulisiibacteriota bacterium]MBU1954547.1 GspE/PulE family protein [Candidatus Margulisiibacteriota bacterium]